MKEFIEAPKIIYQKAKKDKRLIENKSLKQLKELALKQNGVVLTQIGSVAADSEPMSRALPKTKNSIDDKFGEEEKKLVQSAKNILAKEKIISLDAPVGKESRKISVRFLIPEKYAQLAYGLKLLFGDLKHKIKNPTYHIVFFTDEAFENNKKYEDVRKKDITIRSWLGSKKGEQVKICRNSIYLGEGKKGVFQFESWRVKKIDKEGIFLHAGVRKDLVWRYSYETKRPELEKMFTAIAGLTATGKTTTLCRKFTRLPRDKSEMIGDDGGAFNFKGNFSNFESSGIYIKTERLDFKEQPEIYQAALAQEAFLENVSVGNYPYIPDFNNLEKTSNGRAVISRANLKIASRDLCAPRIDYILILTRNPLINIISKLTLEQAIMQFILGESIESSGGNPVEAGKFKRVFFLDPWAIGDKIEHAMIFYEFLKRNSHIQCYLANTGTIGEKEENITFKDSLAAYNDLLRGQIKFSSKPDILGYYYPIQADRADTDKLVAQEKFRKKTLERKIKDFLKGRKEYIEKIEAEGKKIPVKIKNSLRWK